MLDVPIPSFYAPHSFIHFPLREARLNTKGVESSSPGLPESARATLGIKANQPITFERSEYLSPSAFGVRCSRHFRVPSSALRVHLALSIFTPFACINRFTSIQRPNWNVKNFRKIQRSPCLRYPRIRRRSVAICFRNRQLSAIGLNNE